MPYIRQKDRIEIDERMSLPAIRNPGELNYVFTTFATEYWRDNGQNYQAFNDILGALEGCKLELYRRKIAPYEDKKILENGDV